MLIKEIVIENFRCFKNITIELEQLSILVGENGVGKTSILEAINYGLSPYFLSSRLNSSDFSFKTEDPFTISLYFDETFNATLPDGWTTQDIPCNGISLAAKKRQKATAGKAFSDGYTTSHYLIPDITHPSIRKIDEDKWSIPRKSSDSQPFNFTSRSLIVGNVESTNLPRCFYFDKNRENQSKIGFNSTLQKISDDFNWRFRNKLPEIKADFLAHWNKLYELIINNVGDKQIKSTIKPLKTKLKEILGDKFENLELSLILLEEPFSKSFFSIREGIHQLEKSNLGSGISMILTVVFLDIISNLSKEKLTILIDEPELHLHPQLQEILYKYFAASDNQIIFTTHSENFIDISGWKGIKRLDHNFNVYPTDTELEEVLIYKGNQQTVQQNLEDLTKYYYDKSTLIKEQNRIMFAKKCLIVEGPIEKYCFDILPSKNGYDFKYCTIVCAYGKEKIKNLQLLCKAFGIPFFTVFDLDNKTIEDDENKAIIDFSFEGDYYHFTDSFETILGTKNHQYKTSESMKRIENIDKLPTEISELFDLVKKFNEK